MTTKRIACSGDNCGNGWTDEPSTDASAEASGHRQSQIALCPQFGYNLGVLRQLADDFNDLWNPRGPSDLALGKRTLPVVYALAVAQPPERDHLEKVLERAGGGDGGAEETARQIITAFGTPLYLIAQAQLHRARAETALRELGGPPGVQTHLRALLDRVLPMNVAWVIWGVKVTCN